MTGLITWTTDVPSSSQVEYGFTTSYGTLSIYDPTRVTNHSIQLFSLTPGALYHYRVHSRSVAGTEYVGTDQTFTVPSSGGGGGGLAGGPGGTSMYWGALVDYQGGFIGPGSGGSNGGITGAAISTMEANAGKTASVVGINSRWLNNGVANQFSGTVGLLNDAYSHGRIISLDWGVWDLGTSGAANNALINYQNIINGATSLMPDGITTIDQFVTGWAVAMRNWAHPILMRMFHEMNLTTATIRAGDNWPWIMGNVTDGGVSWTNTPALHIAAWRHIVDIFRSVGANNVSFAWNPNCRSASGTSTFLYPYATMYPGGPDKVTGRNYVDWLALDGYAGSATRPWQDYFRGVTNGYTADLDSYAEICALDPNLPLAILETGIHGDTIPGTLDRTGRAVNYANALAVDIPSMPRLDLVKWFWTHYDDFRWTPDLDGGGTNNVDMIAFRNGIGSGHYIAGGQFTYPPDMQAIPRYRDTPQSPPHERHRSVVLSTTGLRGFYRLADSIGSATVVDDSPAASAAATVNGTVTLGQPGVGGQYGVTASSAETSAAFTAAATTSFIDAGNDADWSFTTTGTWSVEIGFILQSTPTGQMTLVGKGASTQFEWDLGINATQLTFIGWSLNGSTYINIARNVVPTLNTPHLVQVTIDQNATPHAHIFLDGVELGTGSTDSVVSPVPVAGTATMLVGKRGDNSRALANAIVGKLSVYNVVLSAQSIADHYSAFQASATTGYRAVINATPNLRAFYRLSEPAGATQLVDDSVQGHTPGTINGGIVLGGVSATPSTPTDTTAVMPATPAATAFLDLGLNNDFSIPNTGALSIEVALTLTSAPTALSTIVSKGTTTQFEWELALTTTQVTFVAWDANGNTYLSIQRPLPSLNTPHLITVTLDTAASPRGHLMLDANLATKANSADVAGITPVIGTAHMLVGVRGDGVHPLGNARIGNLSLYNVALSDATIQAHFAAWNITNIGNAFGSINQPTATATGTAAVSVSGSGTPALAHPTLVASGTVAGNLTGSGAPSLSSPTLVGVGTLTFPASGTLSLPHPTALGSSISQNAILLNGVTVAAVGNVSGGTLSVIGARTPTMAAVATVQLVGTAPTLSLPRVSALGSGTAPVIPIPIPLRPVTALGLGSVINPPPVSTPSVVFTWIDPSLNEHQLSGLPDLEIVQGRSGLYMPPVKITEDSLPGLGGAGGSRLRDQLYDSREIDLPLYLHCQDYSTLWSRYSEIESWFRVRHDSSGRPIPGRLRVKRPDGSEREISCVYSGGLEGAEGQDVSGPNFRRMMLVLRASDPLWSARNPTLLVFTMVAGTTFFSTPFLPVHLGASEVATGAVAANPGEELTWPVWQIVGPGVNPILTNNTTGLSLGLTLALTAGQSITIDTRPRQKTIINDQTTANLYSALAPGSATMWPLQPGDNTIQVLMSGATSASRLNLQFTPSFLGA